MSNQQSQLYAQALKIIPGGVNSPARTFHPQFGEPRFITQAKGAYLWDVDHHRYIDYLGAWGAMILGHGDDDVLAAIQTASRCGLMFGTVTAAETELAMMISHCMPSLEQVRLTCSGTEAVMSAIRLARGFTQRQKIIKFEGCYHGHADSVLVQAGSGLVTMPQASSAGVLASTVAETLVLNYNDIESVTACFHQYPESIAAIIVEPIAGNMNMVRPRQDFLQGLRRLCDKYQSLLIFDEVMTGFRVALGGAQSLFGIRPDLTCLGKVVGGGMPLAAFGGRFDVMQQLAPLGGVYQGGTYTGHPVAVASGIATLKKIQSPDFYERLAQKSQRLCQGVIQIGKKSGIPLQADSIGGLFGIYFADKIPSSFAEVKELNEMNFVKFLQKTLPAGLYFAPSMFESGFMSIQHNDEVIEETLMIVQDILDQWHI